MPISPQLGTITDAAMSAYAFITPSLANDANLETWADRGNIIAGAGSYISGLKRDLGAAYALDRHYIVGLNLYGWSGTVLIQSSDDGSSWTTRTATTYTTGLLGGDPDYPTLIYEHAAVSARYWRLHHTITFPGLSNSGNLYIREWEIEELDPFAADFSGTPTSGSNPLAVQFTDESGDGSGTPVAWEWDFGDSNVSTEQNPLHVYAAPGTYTVTLKATDSLGVTDSETKVAYITVALPAASDPTETPTPGFWVDWDNDGFASGGTSDHELARMLPEGEVADDDVTPWVKSIVWQRGGQQDLIGGQSVGTLTAILSNVDGRFTPDNAAGPLYGKLDVGRRVWFGAERSTGTVKGLWAGYIKEIVPLPRAPHEVQLVCHDAFGVWQDARVRVAFSLSRTGVSFRRAILTALGLDNTRWTLASESYPLAVSGADQKNALQLLEQLNLSTGIRHLILPADDKNDHWFYRTIGRNDNLGIDTPAGSLDENDITNMAGYRRTYQTIVNYQQVTPHQVEFAPDIEDAWEYAEVPFYVAGSAVRKMRATFSQWVRGAHIVIEADGGTTEIVSYGKSADITLNGVGEVRRLRVRGRLGSEPGISAEFSEDIPSQVRYEGVREGPTVDAVFQRSGTQAKGLADLYVVRGKAPRTRPQVMFRNRYDKTLSFDHGDVVEQSVAEFAVVDRRYEIVGVGGALSMTGKVWDFTWTYLETPYQATLNLFTLDESELNGPDILGF